MELQNIFNYFNKKYGMKRNGIIAGALILSFGSVLAKVFSAIYRIILTRILGGEGIGIYQLIFPVYSLCVVVTTAGLPMAISKVVSRNEINSKNVLKKCLFFSAIISIVLSFILFISAKELSALQGNKEISICYMILSPTLIFVTFSSVLRGYFQGKHNFVPSSISNILEQFVKMLVGLILSVGLIGFGLISAVAGAIVGIVVSEVVSLLILLFFIKKENVKSETKHSVYLKDILKDVLPITINNLILPISAFIDSIIVVNILSKNFSHNISVFLYGLESGAVSSLISIPTIFSFALASVILPNIAKQKNLFNKNIKLSFALKIVYVITIPCVICFLLVPNRLIEFLYGDRLNSFGINGGLMASRLLSISSVGVLFLTINQIYSSCLQAVDERFVTTRNLLIAVVLKFMIEILFLPSKMLNIYALVIANLVCYLTAATLNHFEIKKSFDFKFNNAFWGKLLLSNTIMLFVMLLVMMCGEGAGNTLFAGLIAGSVYLFSLFYFKIITAKDKAILKFKY